MKRCWDPDPDKRPTAEELFKYIYRWNSKFPVIKDFSRIPVPENEPIIQSHPLTCYTSRKINFYQELNKLLDEELSSKLPVYSDVVVPSDSSSLDELGIGIESIENR